MSAVFPLVEIIDEDADNPRIVNPNNIDQVCRDKDGKVTVFFHGGSTWTIHNKQTGSEVYNSFREEIARQKGALESMMRQMKSGIVVAR